MAKLLQFLMQVIRMSKTEAVAASKGIREKATVKAFKEFGGHFVKRDKNQSMANYLGQAAINQIKKEALEYTMKNVPFAKMVRHIQRTKAQKQMATLHRENIKGWKIDELDEQIYDNPWILFNKDFLMVAYQLWNQRMKDLGRQLQINKIKAVAKLIKQKGFASEPQVKEDRGMKNKVKPKDFKKVQSTWLYQIAFQLTSRQGNSGTLHVMVKNEPNVKYQAIKNPHKQQWTESQNLVNKLERGSRGGMYYYVYHDVPASLYEAMIRAKAHAGTIFWKYWLRVWMPSKVRQYVRKSLERVGIVQGSKQEIMFRTGELSLRHHLDAKSYPRSKMEDKEFMAPNAIYKRGVFTPGDNNDWGKHTHSIPKTEALHVAKIASHLANNVSGFIAEKQRRWGYRAKEKFEHQIGSKRYRATNNIMYKHNAYLARVKKNNRTALYKQQKPITQQSAKLYMKRWAMRKVG